MSKNVAVAESTETAQVDSIELSRDIDSIARAVIKRKVATEADLAAECIMVANEHWVKVCEVYRKVWNKVSDELHPTHPAGKTQAYYVLKERGEQ